MSWILNDPPPNITDSLLDCRRYAVNLTQWATAYTSLALGFASAASPNNCHFIISLPVEMRCRPTAIVFGVISHFQLYNSETDFAVAKAISIVGFTQSAVELMVSASKPLTLNVPYALRLTNAESALLLSADL